MTRFQSNWLTLKELNCLFHVSLMNLCKTVDLLRTNSHPGIPLESLVRSSDDVTCYEGGGDMVPSSRQPGQYKFHSIILKGKTQAFVISSNQRYERVGLPCFFTIAILHLPGTLTFVYKGTVYLLYIHGVFDSCSSCTSRHLTGVFRKVSPKNPMKMSHPAATSSGGQSMSPSQFGTNPVAGCTPASTGVQLLGK